MTFSNRHAVEEHMALQVDGGVIVEIGVATGNGLVALLKGNRYGRLLPIYAVDHYEQHVDNLGGTYFPEDKQVAIQQVEATGLQRFVHFIDEDGLTVGQKWELPVSLLWIDISESYQNLKAIFDAWKDHVIVDGYIAITGLGYPNLGTAQVTVEAVESGEFDLILTEQSLVAVLKKRPDYKRAVFYIAHGNRYAIEASKHAESVKEHMPGVETFLFAVGDTTRRPNIDHSLPLPARNSDLWYLDSTRYFNIIVERLIEYERLLYLDTDTYMGWDCMDMWWLLDNYDLCLGHSAGRDATPSAMGTPPAFTVLSIGVNLFKNNEAVRATYADWLAYYEKYQHIYEDNDEAALRDVLYRNKHKLQIYVLPPEYSCRANFGCWLKGRMRIVHARLPNLPETAKELNEVASMRMWRYGYLWYHGMEG